MILLVGGAVGTVLGGPLTGMVAVAVVFAVRKLKERPPQPTPLPLVLLLLLVELRSGLSVLAALGKVATTLPDDLALGRVYNVARVAGLTESVAYADARLSPVVSQLSRSQRSGASLSGVVRRMIDSELQRVRTERIAKARSVPVKLMIPVTLLMLPGLVLMLYAPSLLAMFEDLTGGLT